MSAEVSAQAPRRTLRSVLGQANRWVDVPLVLRRCPSAGRPAVVMVCIYRARNAAPVRALVDAVHESGSGRCVLWALDEVVPDLAKYTAGCGAGSKFALLDALLDTAGLAGETSLLVADDDVCFRRGDLRRFLALVEVAGLDVAQPAHASTSAWNHHLLLVRPRVRVRWTNFVEIGPLFVFSPRAVRTLVPFGGAARMGWGLERVWSGLAARDGLTIGVVDEVTMVHLFPAGRSYDWRAAQQDQEALWRAHGLPAVDEPHTTTRVWRVGRPRPRPGGDRP